MRARTALYAALTLGPALTLALLVPTRALGDDGDDSLSQAATRLVGDDAEARVDARDTLSAAGADAVPALLRLVEELRAAIAATRPPARPGEEIGLVRADEPVTAPATRSGASVVQIYDVTDLVTRVDFDGDADNADELLEDLRAAGGAGLESLRRVPSGAVVVMGPPDVHARISAALDAKRRQQAELIAVETRFLLAPRTASLGVGLESARPGDVLLTESAVERSTAWARSGDVEIVTAPRLSAFDGQNANVQIGRQVTYVSDFDVEVGSNGQRIADPVIDTLFVGSLLEFTPQLDGGGGVRISMTLTQAELREPIERLELLLPGMELPVEIQAPQTFESRMQKTLLLEDGATVLMAAPGTPSAHRMLLISARRVRVAAAEDPDAERR